MNMQSSLYAIQPAEKEEANVSTSTREQLTALACITLLPLLYLTGKAVLAILGA